MEFGHTTDSLILALGKTTARIWALNRLSDTKTNYFAVTYINDTNGGVFYPARIDYTGNTTEGLSPYNSVQFVYAPRPDYFTFYQAGSSITTTARLTNIKMFAGASLVSDYQIAYQNAATVPLSRVSGIKACAADSSCLPATSFVTTDDVLGTFSLVGQALGANFGVPVSTNYSLVGGDFKGDGKSDFALIGGNQIYGLLSNSDGTFTQTNQVQGPNFGSPPGSTYGVIVGDFNGDGKSDYALIGGNQIYGFLSNGDGTFTLTGQTLSANFGSPPSSSYDIVLGDFNGDGRSDFRLIAGAQIYGFLSKGDGTFTLTGQTLSANFGVPIGALYMQVSGDFNGDGRSDYALIGANQIYGFLSNGDGTFTQTNQVLGPNDPLTEVGVARRAIRTCAPCANGPSCQLVAVALLLIVRNLLDADPKSDA
jgi:FG-GAP-like repeat